MLSKEKKKIMDNAVVVNPEMARESPYAGVVAARQAGLRACVVYLNKPVTSLTGTEEDAIIDFCCKVNPQLDAIRSKQVKLSLNEDGYIANADEWLATNIGLFEFPVI